MVLYALPSLRCWNLAPVDRVANKQDVEMHRCVPSSVKRTVEGAPLKEPIEEKKIVLGLGMSSSRQ